MRVTDLDAAERAALAEPLQALAVKAGQEILAVYGREFAVRDKRDASPVTDADERSEALILAHHPVVPVVEAGHVVGIVRTETLAGAGTTPVGEIASPAVTVRMDASIREAEKVAEGIGGPIPVVDGDDRLVGLWEAR